MRPPVLPSGNRDEVITQLEDMPDASMRPPVLPSGNAKSDGERRRRFYGFNEAAGFTQRKLGEGDYGVLPGVDGFNEAAGFTQRKLGPQGIVLHVGDSASMRPPVLPSGNMRRGGEVRRRRASGFNEAAGFTQRKPPPRPGLASPGHGHASMRPPVLPSGN